MYVSLLTLPVDHRPLDVCTQSMRVSALCAHCVECWNKTLVNNQILEPLKIQNLFLVVLVFYCACPATFMVVSWYHGNTAPPSSPCENNGKILKIVETTPIVVLTNGGL